MSPEHVYDIFSRFAKINAAPVTELKFRSPFQLLVAVILSAQATDKTVNQVTPLLFAEAPTPEKMVALGEEKLITLIQRIGLYRNKAKNILKTSQILIDTYNSQVPKERAELEALPGVGRKTANIILNTLYGQPTIAVDTHVFRVANRTGLAPGNNVRTVEDGLLRIVPPDFMKDAHHWLVLHGRYICKARQPECQRCPIADLCEYTDKVETI